MENLKKTEIMNNIFKKGDIKLDDRYNLVTDGDSGVVLILKESRVNGKGEDYIFTDKWYFPSIGMALERYVRNSNNKFSEFKEVIDTTNRTYDIINDFKTKYKNW
jgi:hypothetical protein